MDKTPCQTADDNDPDDPQTDICPIDRHSISIAHCFGLNGKTVPVDRTDWLLIGGVVAVGIAAFVAIGYSALGTVHG